jgi:hypothetical protein
VFKDAYEATDCLFTHDALGRPELTGIKPPRAHVRVAPPGADEGVWALVGSLL